jgi:hypothetical protein
MDAIHIVAYWISGVGISIMLLPLTVVFANEFFEEMGYLPIAVWTLGWPVMLPLGILKYIYRCIDK